MEWTLDKKAEARRQFISKLRGQLRSIKDPHARQTKLEQINGMLEQRLDRLLTVTDLNVPDVRRLKRTLAADYGVVPVTIEHAALQPQAPVE